MRILLTSSASYVPPRGGSTRSNRVWLEHLAAHGHACRVVCGIAPSSTAEQRAGIQREAENQGFHSDPSLSDHDVELEDGTTVSLHAELTRRRGILTEHIRAFAPDWVLVSSEDLGHSLLGEASAAAPSRVVYLAHTPQFFPFGPESWNRDASATRRVHDAAAVVAISQRVANYTLEHSGRHARVIHPPIYGSGPFESFGCFERPGSDRGDVLIVNPCEVKGIRIFLAVAEALPGVSFAALPGWGTTSRDRSALALLPNITQLESVKRIEQVLARTRILLMPSLWFEGFGLIAMEAMLRGIPVISSDSGGLVEAKRGTRYVLPVRPIARYLSAFDEVHMPQPVIEEQNVQPWIEAVRTLTSDREAYEAEASRSRESALHFVSGLHAADFEDMLEALVQRSPEAAPKPLKDRLDRLSVEQRALLLARVKASRERP